MMPEHALNAELDAIRAMDEEAILVLRRRFMASPEHLGRLTIEQKVVVNPDGAIPDGFDLVEDGQQELLGSHFRDPMNAKHIRLKKVLNADHRWYTVENGLRYSGIVRGTSMLERHCPNGVSLLTHHSAGSRQAAIDQWLTAFYNRGTSKVDIVRILPSF
jgi:hypothetical protein